MDRTRMIGWMASMGALVFAIVGGAATKWYVWDVVIVGAGEPDRSMLFWGIPILFIGLVALAIAFALGMSARDRLRPVQQDLG